MNGPPDDPGVEPGDRPRARSPVEQLAIVAAIVIYGLLMLWPILAPRPAPAQTPHNHHGHRGHIGEGHGDFHGNFYSRLNKPGTQTSCCNLNDCRPTSSRAVGAHYEVMINGEWVRVPPEKIVKVTAPDMGAHVCAPDIRDYALPGQPRLKINPDQIYCVVLPPET